MGAFIRQAIKWFLALWVASFLFLSCMVIAMLIVFGSLTDLEFETRTGGTMPEAALLQIDLSAEMGDSPRWLTPADLLQEWLEGPGPSYYTTQMILQALQWAESDDRIQGVVLRGNVSQVSLAQLEEIRAQLAQFRESGKPVHAYADTWLTGDYFLATAADRVFTHPFGGVSVTGMGGEYLFMGDALKRFGIGMQVLKAGRYKSAVEPFIHNELSPEAREQAESLVHNLWDMVSVQVSQSRGFSPQTLQDLASSQGIFQGADALEAGLVDELVYSDEWIDRMAAISAPSEDDSGFASIDLRNYWMQNRPEADAARQKVAVIYIEGVIVDGEGELSQAGSERIIRNLRTVKKDDDIASVVLRINSPGGSAFASEAILREVRLLQEEKPVVVSMGGAAASGGYWIACSADSIFALPSTITGSIGVFGLLPNIEQLAETYGFHFDRVLTSEMADLYSITKPRTPREMAILQDTVDTLYTDFLQRVAEGRDLELERVKELASGRVWTGYQAHENGLVDELGGLGRAVMHAAELGGVTDDWELEEYPRHQPFEAWLEAWFPTSQAFARTRLPHWLKRLNHQAEAWQAALSAFNDPHHAYALSPWWLTFP